MAMSASLDFKSSRLIGAPLTSTMPSARRLIWTGTIGPGIAGAGISADVAGAGVGVGVGVGAGGATRASLIRLGTDLIRLR